MPSPTSSAPPIPSRKPRLSTAKSPYYQLWVLTNLTAKPFPALFGNRFNMNLTEWRVMLTVADYPGISAQELADYSGLDKMSISRVARSLEAQGRLLREGNESDRRMRHLYLTDEGWAVYDEIAKAAITREKQVYTALTKDELHSLHDMLGRLSARAREI